MQLKSIYISQYKNLKDFQLSFNEKSFIDVFVGKNGTGKSNLFEALIEIFHHLYEHDKKTFTPTFHYTIEYEIGGKNIKLEYNLKQLKIYNGKSRKIKNDVLPDNLLIYYSGHNETVTSLIKRYEDTFRQRIKSANLDESRRFIGINSAYKELFLTILIIQDESNKARQFIFKKLGIQSVSSEIKLILKRPFYALNNPAYNVEYNDETDRYWKAAGITKDFLQRLTKCISTAMGSIVRDEGFFPVKDIYVYYLDIKKIQQEFIDLTTQELFRQFDNLKILDMIEEFSISIKLIGNIDANIKDFSDGQFQSVYIYSLIELFKDRNCITLLDEPDCFLHPEWQYEFLTQVFDITEDSAQNNHILMTSHSAVTLCNLNEQTLSLFQIGENNQVFSRQKNKKEVVEILSNRIIQYSEDENEFRINNIIRSSNRPILFVEGITDSVILNTAYKKLYPQEDMPILIQDVFSRGMVKLLLRNKELYENYSHKYLFGLFDFDDAYEDWREINAETEKSSLNDLKEGFWKKVNNFNAYALLLPVPENLKNQVLHQYTDGHGIRNPQLSIEHIFYGISEEINNNFETCPTTNLIKFASDSRKKKKLAKKVEGLDAIHFEIFCPMFNFIKFQSGISTY